MLFIAIRVVLNTALRMIYPFLPVFGRGLGVELSTMSQAVALRSATGALGPFLASVADTFQRRVFWLSPGIILALNLAALSHNLKAWGYASEKARLAIKTVVDCADSGSGNVVVEGVPPILRGVYFLGNGLREGVAMQRGDIAARMEIRQAGEPTVAREGDCLLRWDGSRDEFRHVILPTSP